MKKALAALLMVPSMAMAEFHTGNALLRMLQSDDVVDRIHALGYVQGVVDVYIDRTICPPNVTAGQVRDVVKMYLESNPAIRHRGAESIINDAVKKVWPCPTRRSGSGA